MKINNFQGDLTDTSAKKEALGVTLRYIGEKKDAECKLLDL